LRCFIHIKIEEGKLKQAKLAVSLNEIPLSEGELEGEGEEEW